jgi:integrase
MSESNSNRVVVWVQYFADRPFLMLQWHDPDTGKRKSRSAQTNNPVEAEKKRADLEYELNHGLYLEPSRMTWEKFRQLFEAEYVVGLRSNTRRLHAYALNLFEELCHPGRLQSINERTLSAFVTGMRKKKTRGREGMALTTMEVTVEYLHTALSWAVEQKFLPHVPQFPAVRAPKKDPQPVAAEAFERLLAKAPDANMRAFLLCGWRAGLRLGEAFRLEWEPTALAPCLDLANDRIVLPAELVKGARDQWVPLDPELKEALEALPRDGKRVFRFVKERKGVGGPLSLSAACNRVIRLAREAGVRLTMKSLRRGFACRYAARVPAQVLQKLMRHKSITTTLDYYANVDQAAMEAVLGPGRNSMRNSGQVPGGVASDGSNRPAPQTLGQDGTSGIPPSAG